MAPFLTPFSSQIYAVLRIVAGFLFLQHGSQKLLGFPGMVPPDGDVLIAYTAGPIELIGGLLIMIGLMTRWAAFLCSGLMAAAYWLVHGLDAALPIENYGELAVLYCFVFLYMASKGSGIWSVDALRSGGA